MNEAIDPAAFLAAARGLYYAATMLLFGDLAFSLLILAKLPGILPPRDMRMRWSTLAAAAGAGLFWLVMAARQMAGAIDLPALMQTVTATLFGQLFLARIAALAALAVVLRGARLAVPLALAALALPAATSHAAASSHASCTFLGASWMSFIFRPGDFCSVGSLCCFSFIAATSATSCSPYRCSRSGR